MTPAPPVRMPLTRAAAVVCLLALAAPPLAAGPPYDEGETVRITGQVTDQTGATVPGVKVVLEVSRQAFSLRKMGRATVDDRRLVATTDQAGEYVLDWPWHEYYNRFALVVGVPVKAAGGAEELKIVERLDLGTRITQGTPVVVPIVLGDLSLVESVRDFAVVVDTEDESKIYDQMGRPDRVDRQEYAGYEEISWWYFERGKAYRFRDGKLQTVAHFDPVKPFDSP